MRWWLSIWKCQRPALTACSSAHGGWFELYDEFHDSDDPIKKYWEQKLLEMAQEPTELFKTRYPVTWRQRLHNRFLNAVDWIYEKLTGHCPYEE